jgi:5-methylcytosine-specific restriction endonuclease McrA
MLVVNGIQNYKIKDLINKKFDFLLVIKFAYIKKHYVYWECLCDCGNKTVVKGAYLTRGKTKSCGCKLVHIVDKIGQTFGKLLIVEYEGYRKGNSYWKARCDCGNIISVPTKNLIGGHTKSCGCYKFTFCRKAKGEQGFNLVYVMYKDSAKKRNLSFELSKEDFRSMVVLPCIYCGDCCITGALCTYDKKQRSQEAIDHAQFFYTGIDRLNSNLGYTKENCVPCCRKCNYAKGVMTVEEFKNWIKKVFYNLIGDLK